MDILEKAYDYIDYTLEELARTGESSVSLLYFFKLSSSAGKLARNLLVEHSFIKVEDDAALAVIGITERGHDVVNMGGIRKYLDHLDAAEVNNQERLRKMRKIMIAAACVACSAFLLMMLKNRLG